MHINYDKNRWTFNIVMITKHLIEKYKQEIILHYIIILIYIYMYVCMGIIIIIKNCRSLRSKWIRHYILYICDMSLVITSQSI
jgi:hypothetical protein